MFNRYFNVRLITYVTCPKVGNVACGRLSVFSIVVVVVVVVVVKGTTRS